MKQKISGIYAIINKINGKKYIGSSKSVNYRWNQSHRNELRKNQHCNNHLQNAWNKYGEAGFEFQVIEECNEEKLLEREGHWIEHYRSWEREFGYNLIRIVDGKQIFSEETFKKKSITISTKNYWQTGVNKKILDLFKQGMSKNGIAVHLGITRSNVYSCLEQNGLYKPSGKGSVIKFTDEVIQKIKELRERGVSWKEIFKETGVSSTQAARLGLYGDNKFNSKHRSSYKTIPQKIIKEIKRLRKEKNMTWFDISVQVNVSVTAIYLHGIHKEFKPLTRQKYTLMTEEKKNLALELRKQGVSWWKIAKEIDVSLTNLKNYNKKWINEYNN